MYNLQTNNTYDHLYYASNIAESHWLMGIKSKFYECLEYERDSAGDYYGTFDDPQDISIVFEDNPRSVLEKMNWLAEGEELPYLVYISAIDYPKYKKWRDETDLDKLSDEDKNYWLSNTDSPFLINVTKYSRVEIPYQMREVGTQLFTITQIRGDSVNPTVFTCKLVPHRGAIDMDESTPEIDRDLGNTGANDYNYIKDQDIVPRDRSDDEDEVDPTSSSNFLKGG